MVQISHFLCVFQRGRRLKVCLYSEITRCLPLSFCHTNHISCALISSNALTAWIKSLGLYGCCDVQLAKKKNIWKVKINRHKLEFKKMRQTRFIDSQKRPCLQSRTLTSVSSALSIVVTKVRLTNFRSLQRNRETNMKQHRCVSDSPLRFWSQVQGLVFSSSKHSSVWKSVSWACF